MHETAAISRLLAPYEPQLPIPELVPAINQLYHRFEARDYDRRHPEVHRQLPRLWQEMIAVARLHAAGYDTAKLDGDALSLPEELDRPDAAEWGILNIGCGTGFEAEQLLHALPATQLVRLTCYDPSPAMLERCRARIAPLFPAAIFCSDLRDLPHEPYNLLATNSLLHHLPHPMAQIAGLLPRLERTAVWLAGHEPSRRYYANPICQRIYRQFAREERWRKLLEPARYLARARQLLGLASDPPRQTARAAVAAGLFKRRPSPLVVSRLVDLHVAHSPGEAAAGRGFDIEQWRRELAWAWHNLWFKSYGFMGAHYEGDLEGKWRRAAGRLATQYPADGANFCSVWRRWR